jgi:uncharacterized membrane protein (UPF0127 family)
MPYRAMDPIDLRMFLGRLVTSAFSSVAATGFATTLFGMTLSQAQAQERVLPRTTLQAGMHLIRAEVAGDVDSRARGLMFRERLGPNEGMLFVFEQPSTQCFWMRNTLVPLTIAFLADDGRIVNTADMEPKSEASHCSAEGVRFALEMERGWFAKRGLNRGDRISAPSYFKAP